MENKIFTINKTKTFTEWLKYFNSERCCGVTTCLVPPVEKISKTVAFINNNN